MITEKEKIKLIELFEKMDKNNDGCVSSKELIELYE